MRALSEAKAPKVGVGVIVVRDGKVLAGKRKNAHGDGAWSFPGGHLELNEGVEECAKREVFEETGARVKNLRQGPYTNDVFEKEGKIHEVESNKVFFMSEQVAF